MVEMKASAAPFVPAKPIAMPAKRKVDEADSDEENNDKDESMANATTTTTADAGNSDGQIASSSNGVPASKPASTGPVNNRKRPLANPSMVPQAPRIPKTAAEKESSRRLYIVLSQACLETYQISSGGGSGGARRDGRYDAGEARYTLLNCDDHVSFFVHPCKIDILSFQDSRS